MEGLWVYFLKRFLLDCKPVLFVGSTYVLYFSVFWMTTNLLAHNPQGIVRCPTRLSSLSQHPKMCYSGRQQTDLLVHNPQGKPLWQRWREGSSSPRRHLRPPRIWRGKSMRKNLGEVIWWGLLTSFSSTSDRSSDSEFREFHHLH